MFLTMMINNYFIWLLRLGAAFAEAVGAVFIEAIEHVHGAVIRPRIERAVK